jgi:nucleoside-diphosphate-sugar epimerase
MGMDDVLVTGANGMVGRALVARLDAAGSRVVAHDRIREADEADAGRVEHVQGDLRDVHGLYRVLRDHPVDTVIHGGGISGPMLLRDDPFQVNEINVIASAQLLEAARACGVRRFVFLSSAAAYGDTPTGPVSEDAPRRPKDVYGASKGAVELLVAGYRGQCGFDGVSLRLSNVYGPGRRTSCAIKTMLEDARAGRATRFDWGAGESRPYCYLDDAVDAVVAACRAPRIARAVYNVAGPEFVAMERVAEAVRRAVPQADIGFEPGLDGIGYRRDARDLSAAAEDLGFVPAVGIDDGVARYHEWMASSARAK